MTPHQKIMRAARRGTGVRLSAEDVAALAMDDAIATCAANDDEGEDIRPAQPFDKKEPTP